LPQQICASLQPHSIPLRLRHLFMPLPFFVPPAFFLSRLKPTLQTPLTPPTPLSVLPPPRPVPPPPPPHTPPSPPSPSPPPPFRPPPPLEVFFFPPSPCPLVPQLTLCTRDQAPACQIFVFTFAFPPEPRAHYFPNPLFFLRFHTPVLLAFLPFLLRSLWCPPILPL